VILADTSVWIDHIRRGDEFLQTRLLDSDIAMHPVVQGEIALGHLKDRAAVLDSLGKLPQAEVATDLEVREYIERQKLIGLGIGYADVHLLASATLSQYGLWTRDKRLRNVAQRLGVAAKGLA
jgi:predicted nucleic acid-binding protein